MSMQYLTKSLYFMILALKPCLFLRVLSLFAANRQKSLYMNHLQAKLSRSQQTKSNQIKAFFLNHRAHHSIIQYLSDPLRFHCFAGQNHPY